MFKRLFSKKLSTEVQELSDLTTRKKIAYAALCMAQFCHVKGIRQGAVAEWLEWMFSVLVADDVRTWDERTDNHELGVVKTVEDLSPSIRGALPETVSPELFLRLVIAVSYTAMDMYGADTEKPLKYLLETTDILKSQGVALPAVEIVKKVRQAPGHGTWGMPANADDYNTALSSLEKMTDSSVRVWRSAE